MAIQLTLEKAAQFLQAAQDVLILTHKSPDGDTLGSARALELLLRRELARRDIRYFPDVPSGGNSVQRK